MESQRLNSPSKDTCLQSPKIALSGIDSAASEALDAIKMARSDGDISTKNKMIPDNSEITFSKRKVSFSNMALVITPDDENRSSANSLNAHQVSVADDVESEARGRLPKDAPHILTANSLDENGSTGDESSADSSPLHETAEATGALDDALVNIFQDKLKLSSDGAEENDFLSNKNNDVG